MGNPDRRTRRRRRSDRQPQMAKKSSFLDLLKHLFTPSLDPVRVLMPMTWLSDHKVPPRVLTLIISVLVGILGYTVAEINNNRNGREAEIERLVRSVHPALDTRVVVLELKVAGQEGTIRRIEDQVNKSSEKLDSIQTTLTRLTALVQRDGKGEIR